MLSAIFGSLFSAIGIILVLATAGVLGIIFLLGWIFGAGNDLLADKMFGKKK